MKQSRWIMMMATSLVIGLQSMPAFAAGSITPQQVLDRLKSPTVTQGFSAKRNLRVYRQNSKPFTATADVVFADRNNYNLKITAPATIEGIQFNMKQGVNTAYFRDEKLFLTNGGQNTSYMPERIILSLFNPRVDLISRNYEIKVLDDDFLNATPVYVVEFIPKNTTTTLDQKTKIALVPRRKYWIDKETFLVLKENRYWDSLSETGAWNFSNDPYSEAWYDSPFKKSAKPAVPALNAPSGVNQVNLSGKDKNSFLTYKTKAEAEAKEKIKISLPTFVPKGFELKDIQVFTLFGGRIQVLNYTDGINDLMITIRPQQNAFVTLMAGAFSLNLIKKITDLSHQAPNNYYSNNTEARIAVAFGDLTPDELNRVATSLTY